MKRKTTFKLALPISLGTLAILSPLSLTSCGSGGIVLANFESYMSTDLMDQLRDEHSIRFVNYSTNEDIMAKFTNSYDIAVPSTYCVLEMIRDGILGEIDWEYLGEEYGLIADDERVPEDVEIKTINNALPHNVKNPFAEGEEDTSNAQWLFSEAIDNVIDAVDDYAHDNHYYSSDKSILQYALPYFLQDWMFAYHGDYIPALPSSTDHNGEWYSSKTPNDPNTPITWQDVVKVISTKNPTDSRFQPEGKRPMMTMVDDSRTVYDMSHLIYDEQNYVDVPSINPSSNQTSIEWMNNIYDAFTNEYNNDKNAFLLNSDSQQVLYSFANPGENLENPKYGESNGIIAYNGDVLYSVMGAGIEDWEDAWYCDYGDDEEIELTDGNTHIVKLKDTPVALDMMVINKKINNSAKKDEVYDILHKIILEGCDLHSYFDEEDPDESWIGSVDEDDSFINGPTLNFDYVAYTPTLWNLNKFVAREEDNPSPDNSYFDMMYEDEPEKAELLAEINNVNFGKDDGRLLELPLSNLAKSNMSFVYMQQKEKL